MCVIRERGGLWFSDRGGDWGFFRVKDLLGRPGRTRSRIGLGPTISSIVTSFSTPETSSFSHAFSAFLGREFLESDGVNFHCIRVDGSSRGRVRGSEVGVPCPSSELVDL